MPAGFYVYSAMRDTVRILVRDDGDYFDDREPRWGLTIFWLSPQGYIFGTTSGEIGMDYFRTKSRAKEIVETVYGKVKSIQVANSVLDGWDGKTNPKDEGGWAIDPKKFGGIPGVDRPVNGRTLV